MGSERMEIGVKDEMRNDGVVRWEKFLPKMVMRVLLVEADDSTRQIITALLRKCSYKGTNLYMFSFVMRTFDTPTLDLC